MNASEQIKHQAPIGATHYRVSARLPAGGIHTVPLTTTLPLGCPLPYDGVAPGRYSVLYYNLAGDLLPDTGVSIQVDGRVEASALAMLFDEHSKRAAAGGGPAVSDHYIAEAEDDSEPEAEDDEVNVEPAQSGGPDRRRERYADLLVEGKMINMQLKAQRQQQTFIRDSAHTREVGETHQLNGFLRRDLIETQQLMLQNVKDQLRDFTQQRLHWDEDMQTLRERYQARMAEMTPPPPPTDWAAPVSQLITGAQNVALAFFQSKNPRRPSLGAGEDGHTLPKVADRTDHEEVQAAKISSAPSGPLNPPLPPNPPDPPRGDPAVLKRVKELLTQLTEAEVAAIASNPLALLELLAPKNGPGSKPAGES